MGRKKTKAAPEAELPVQVTFEAQVETVRASLLRMGELRADYENTLQQAEKVCEAATRCDFTLLKDRPFLAPPPLLDTSKLHPTVAASHEFAEHLGQLQKADEMLQRFTLAEQNAAEGSVLRTRKAEICKCIDAVIAWSDNHLRSRLPVKHKA